MNHSIKIEAIKNGNGYKLIAYSKVINVKGVKPWVSPCSFADYKDGILRLFFGNSIESKQVLNFKEALQYLRKSL